ncbi:MAG: ATP-dependent DNA ligase [Proteobacteria bacterium]|nr:ATP-dependent DNA ligase [Pseudomonadota bacterium]
MEPIAPMEAKLVDQLPDEPGWQYEPKWDGFRAIAVRDGSQVELWSKSGKPLARYFPELVEALAATPPKSFVLDGEIILPLGDVLSFDALQARLHPAPSRIARLAKETPAQLMLFDLLALEGEQSAHRPLAERRAALEALFPKLSGPSLRLSPATTKLSAAKGWLDGSGGALDGVVAKRRDEPYRGGERAMLKVKQLRTADCVVGGFRKTESGKGVASLLLGLYDDKGKLDHVGFTSAIAAAERGPLLARLEPLVGGPGFTGKAPGGPSRWQPKGDATWIPLKPELVVEVIYDQVTGNRFRHGTRLHRWRPDKAPRQCTLDQLRHELRPTELETLLEV